MNNKTFQIVDKKSKAIWVVIRQVAGIDKIYNLGSKIPGYGKVIGIKIEEAK